MQTLTLVGLVLFVSPELVTGKNLRQVLLDLGHDRLNTWWRNSNNFKGTEEKDGVKYRISEDDFVCGGDAVPLTFVEYDVDGARPIDVFNVLADVNDQPSWDENCLSMTLLGEFDAEQARGYAAVFDGTPVANREGLEWLVVDANTTTEEFWVVFSTIANEALQQSKPVDPKNKEMQNCLGAYKITKTPRGAHVENTQQVNSHPWPLKSRPVAAMAYSHQIGFANALREMSTKQAQMNWNSTRVAVPNWMLETKTCQKLTRSSPMRESMLSNGIKELAKIPADRGAELSPQRKAGGQQVRIWRGPSSNCHGQSVPMWHVEFEILGATPEAVFSAVVAKKQQQKWDRQMTGVELLNFSEGVRGVHEGFSMAHELRWIAEQRELWEYQAAWHSLENDTYFIVFKSMSETPGKMFESRGVVAYQCLAAYEVSPASDHGTKVHMTGHFNPKGWRIEEWMFGNRIAQELFAQFAEDLSSWSNDIAALRFRRGDLNSMIDPDALRLLNPNFEGVDNSLTVRSVLDSSLSVERFATTDNTESTRLQRLARLNIPLVLDARRWDEENAIFSDRAAELHELLKVLEGNATAVEKAIIGKGVATDRLELQVHGEVLANLQVRAADMAECLDVAVPNIDKKGTPSGLTITEVILALALVVVLVAIPFVIYCVVRRRRRRNREMCEVLVPTDLIATAEVPSAVVASGVGSSVMPSTV